VSAPRAAALVAPLALVPVSLIAQGAAGAGAAVRVAGAPGSYQVVAVPVPPGFAPGRPVAFEVIPAGTAPLLGARGGTLEPGPGARVVALSVGVPAGAHAGRTVVAQVRFAAEGLTAAVPVELDVARVRRAALALRQATAAARLGERVVVGYRLTNAGNAPDTFLVRASVPAGWRAIAARTHVLEAGAAVDGVVAMAVPRNASTGSAEVVLAAADGAGELVRAPARLEVVGTDAARPGDVWRVTPGVAAVFGDTAAAAPVFGLDLEGPVTPAVRLYGHLVQSAGLDAAHLWGLSRVGYFPGTNFLSLAGPRWRLTGGRTSQAFSDITGINLWGSGAAGTYAGPQWSAAALAAVPVTPGSGGGGSGGGHLLGGQLGVAVAGGWLRGTATDAVERTVGGRELRALGLGGSTPPLFATQFSAEVAQRWFAGGRGLGWLAEAKRQGEGEYLLVRYTHAPGGSAAYAPAREQLTAYGSRRLTAGVIVNGGAWVARDTSPAFRRLTSSGWSVAPQFALSDWATLEVEARGNRFDATDSAATFGNRETDGRVGVTARLGRLVGAGSLSVGRVTRTTAFAGGAGFAPTAERWEAGGTVQWITPAGVLEATADYQQSGAGVGLLPRQYWVGLRADAVPVPAHGDVLLNAGVQRYEWFGVRPSATVVRFGLRAPFPGLLVVRLDAEHNPLFLSSAGGAGWNVALKLEHPLAIRARTAAVTGVVYRDLNGNGRLDPGEPAVPGALVRRDGETAVTDGRGRFQFFRATDAPTELDESSLPFGLVVNPATEGARGARRLEIAVTPTAPVEVRLVITVPAGTPAPQVDLRKAVVRARDERDNVWTARPDTAGRAVFHALPPGAYRVELDLAELGEPLAVRGELPEFRVAAGRAVPPLTIPLHPRPVRFGPAPP
jgi:hypothetical protein